MRRVITALSLTAAATLALAACGAEDHSQHGVVPAPAAGTDTPSAPTSSPEHSHSAAAAPTSSASASASASESHSGHVEPVEPVDDHHDDHGGHKDVPLKRGATYVIASSTDQTRFRLTIESFDCKATYPLASSTPSGTPTAFRAASGKMLCVATVSGKNIDDAPDFAALNYFAVAADADDNEYDETASPEFTTVYLMDGKAPLEASVDPGQTGWMVLGYEVPTTARGVSLRIDTAPPSH